MISYFDSCWYSSGSSVRFATLPMMSVGSTFISSRPSFNWFRMVSSSVFRWSKSFSYLCIGKQIREVDIIRNIFWFGGRFDAIGSRYAVFHLSHCTVLPLSSTLSSLPLPFSLPWSYRTYSLRTGSTSMTQPFNDLYHLSKIIPKYQLI